MVVEDRIEKEKARRKADQEAIELKAGIRVNIIQVEITVEVLFSIKRTYLKQTPFL